MASVFCREQHLLWTEHEYQTLLLGLLPVKQILILFHQKRGFFFSFYCISEVFTVMRECVFVKVEKELFLLFGWMLIRLNEAVYWYESGDEVIYHNCACMLICGCKSGDTLCHYPVFLVSTLTTCAHVVLVDVVMLEWNSQMVKDGLRNCYLELWGLSIT